MGLCGAVDDERGAGQRLERRSDVAVGIEVVRPRYPAAQGKGGAIKGKRYVRAQTQFRAARGDVTRAVSEGKRICSRYHMLGIGRQFEGRELSGGIGRQANP